MKEIKKEVKLDAKLSDKKIVSGGFKPIPDPINPRPRHIDITRGPRPIHLDITLGPQPKPRDPLGPVAIEFAQGLDKADILALDKLGCKFEGQKLLIPENKINDAVKILDSDRIISRLKK